MILDWTTFIDSMYGLVGFKNPTNPDYPNVSQFLTESRSGFYINSVHPLLTPENIDQSAKNFDKFNYQDWSITEEYKQGDKTTQLGVNYEYINQTPSTGNLVSDTMYWREINNYSDFLTEAYQEGVVRLFNALFSAKKIRSRTKSIFDSMVLFTGIANKNRLVANEDSFVGIRVRMRRGERSIVTLLNEISTHFTEVVDIPFYIYHTSQNEPVFVGSLNHTKPNSSQWHKQTGIQLRYLSDDYDAGGDFYMGYKQSDLNGQAFDRDLNWNKAPCNCEPLWYNNYQQYSKYIDVLGFKVPESEIVNDTIFDVDKVELVSTSNFGLNFKVATKCDIATFINQEEVIFADALRYSIGLVLLEGEAFTTRQENQVAGKNQQKALGQIYSMKEYKGTVHDRYQEIFKGVSFDMSNLNDSCLPCDDDSELYITTSSV